MKIVGRLATVAALLVLSVVSFAESRGNFDKPVTVVNGYDTPPKPW
jgi:hypothetical protein